MKDSAPLYVTQPFLPPLEEFQASLEEIWKSRWLTNSGPFHHQLETELAGYLGVDYLSLFANGTIALVTALQALRVSGEVITTPYSFVATSHSLLWNSLTPVFADIDPQTCNLDPEKIEQLITPRTSAILPVHCYGNPCDVERIQRIADTYGLKVIYDAAHAFAVKVRDESILGHGDLSVLSFHATKIFNTFEGGAIVCQDAKTKERIDNLKNFGFADEVTVVAPGINGKMNEVQAAFGLLHLRHMDAVLKRRLEIDQLYRRELSGLKGIKFFNYNPEATRNGSYFPIFVEKDCALNRDDLYHLLKAHNVHSRRYFYPLISTFPMYRGLPSASPACLPHATTVADQVLCLPIYPALTDEDLYRVVSVIQGGC